MGAHLLAISQKLARLAFCSAIEVSGKVDSKTERMSSSELVALIFRVLTRHGVSDENARILAEVVSAAERDGTLSHGLLRLPGYVSTLKSGWVDGRAVPQITDAASSMLVADGKNGFAQVALQAARPTLEAKARDNGVALLAIHNCHHFASLWPDIEPFAENGLVAFACLNSRSRLVVWGSREKALGTNPMAFACPRKGRPPIVWDQASSVLSQGELLLAARESRPVVSGAGLDRNGQTTQNPQEILNGGSFLPFGGHKGADIAFMVEVLAGAVTGARFGFEDEAFKFPGALTCNTGEFVLLIDPTKSAGPTFFSRIESVLENLAARGVGRFPGERRHRNRAKSQASGIEVPAETLRTINELLA